ncbi:MAG TPA: hypothetical protein VME19_01190 [Streptosporangiaceae bacterium]|nr:hypothetical protein [Streptosporangiaceae bacterium]
MSYDPSPRTPPRQDRWPSATPQEAWPAYSGRGEYRQSADYRGAYGGYGAYDGYRGGPADGYYQQGYGYADPAAGYGAPWDGGYDHGYPGAPDDFPGPDPGAGYLDEGEYLEPIPSGALLIAPDALRAHDWGPRRSQGRDRDRTRGGLVVGSVTGFLAAAVAIGAATLAAAFVRPQASPVIAVGGAFIDRTPSAVKNFAVEHFGENDKTMLLLGMYAAIAVLAMVIGCLSRRNAAIGVGGIAAFGLFGAFVAITRPEAQPTDVIPSVVGGLAGIAAFAWLAYAAAPVAAMRHAHGGGRRRAR